jgi:hypothetical protein
MPIESIGVQGLSDLTSRLGPRILYPGFPFMLVPALLAGLIGSQFSGNFTHFPNDRPAALDLPVSLSAPDGSIRQKATLLVVPGNMDDFFLSSDEDGVQSVWLSVPPERMVANKGRVRLEPEGLGLDRLRGVDYPLVVVVEGSHRHTIDPIVRSPQSLPKLELATPEANWIVLSLFGAAVFGFGASTGFFKDRPVAQE